jgi:hypothetical protein
MENDRILTNNLWTIVERKISFTYQTLLTFNDERKSVKPLNIRKLKVGPDQTEAWRKYTT